jgi:hypothetical protein
MEAQQQLYFNPCPTVPYKIVSVMDGHKAFALQEGTNKLVLQDYKGAPNQLFHVYNNNLKYALVNFQANLALHVEGENQNDGGVIKADSGQFQSSYFELEPVTKGEWAGKACHLRTFANGKALDIKGGKCNAGTEICQWKFHGGANQSWVITPADHLPQLKAQQFPQVAPQFSPKPHTIYKVVSVLDHTKALTVDRKSNELAVNTYNGDPFQKFSIMEEHHKFALTLPCNKNALCVFGDKKDNAAHIVADPGKHGSSWFELVRAEKGEYAHRAYLIKTHAGNRAFDIAGGKAEEGKKVLQYNIHEGPNQLWLLVPVENEKATQKAAKVQAKQEKAAEVKPHFQFHDKSVYKVMSHLDHDMVLTLDSETNKLVISEWDEDSSQKFIVHVDKHKIALVATSTQEGLHVAGDKQDNAAPVIAGKDKCASNWFEVVRSEKGEHAHKGYLLKTHAGNKALDISGGKAEEDKPVIQYNIHEGPNQLWHFEEVVEPDVPANFKANPNKQYRVVSVIDRSKGFTIDPQSHKLIIKTFSGEPSQRFNIHQENNKFAFLVDNQQGLCVTGDKQDNAVPIVADPGKHASSWFEIVRADKGNWAKKAYYIKTHAGNKVFDDSGKGQDGKAVLQYNYHGGDNQLWLIEVVQKEKKPAKVGKANKAKNFTWNQQFEFVPAFIHNVEVGVSNPNLFAPNQHYILYAVHGKGVHALDVAQDPQNHGSLIMYSFHGAPNQRFVFEQEGPQYRIRSVASGKYVSIHNDDSHDNAQVKTADKGHKTEIWNILPATEPKYKGQNAYHIRSVFGKALETPAGSLQNSTKIQQGPFNGGEGQTWIIKEI